MFRIIIAVFLTVTLFSCSPVTTITETVIVTENNSGLQAAINQYINLSYQLSLEKNKTEQARIDYENKIIEYSNTETSINLKMYNAALELETVKAELESYKEFSSIRDIDYMETQRRLVVVKNILLNVYNQSDNISSSNATASDKVIFYRIFGKWYTSKTIPDWLK